MGTVEQLRIASDGSIEKENRKVEPREVGKPALKVLQYNPRQQRMNIVIDNDHLGLHGKIPTANGVDRAIED